MPPGLPDALLTAWPLDPLVLPGLLLLAALYGRGLWRLGHRTPRRRTVTWRHVAFFSAGWATLALALQSPLETLSNDLFAVHMVQHLLLLMVAPPLLLLGRPVTVLLWGLPHEAARALARTHWLRALTAALLAPRVAWTLYVGAFLLWHVPALYDAALLHEGIHALEHLSFMCTGLAFWWVVVEPLPGAARRHPGLRLLFVWTPLLPTILLGSLFALTSQPWYHSYVATAPRWGTTVMDDQRMGGIIMWLGGGMMYVLAAALLFFAMLAEEERRELAQTG